VTGGEQRERLLFASPSVSGVSNARRTASLARRTASAGLVAMIEAISTARASALSGSSTSTTSPAASAACALIGIPVSTICIVSALPTVRARRCVPPAPGIMPRLTSGWPNLALLPATRMSQHSASSHPPPRA